MITFSEEFFFCSVLPIVAITDMEDFMNKKIQNQLTASSPERTRYIDHDVPFCHKGISFSKSSEKNRSA